MKPIQPTRLSSKEPTLFDLQNEFDRYMIQTQSLVCALICEDHAEDIGTVHVANLLWLIQDRLSDIDTIQKQVYEKLRRANHG